MKKIFICFILFFGFLFNACGVNGGNLVWEKSALYEINDQNLVKKYYFQYPLEAEVSYKEGSGYINYQYCRVDFAQKISIETPADIDKKSVDKNNKIRESWLKGNTLIFYSAYAEDKSFVFFTYNEEKDVSSCVSFVDKVIDSFTDKPFYYNEKFGFRADILPEYKMEDLPSGEGILIKKWVEDEVCKDEKTGEEYKCGAYKVEISLSASSNIMGYKDVADFVSKKYEGYNTEFIDNNGVSGIYVDEGNGKEAVRHLFMMSEDNQILYEASLRVPSIFYARHKDEFDKLIRSISF